MTRNRPSDAVDIRHGDALDVLRGLPNESVEAFITDPPYGLSQEPDMAEVLTHWLAGDDYKHRGGGFMGRSWDSFVPGPAVWREAYRVLKPGGHLLCFAGSRTSDLMGIAIRLAGFEIRDRIRCETTGVVLPAELAFTYGQGFPKSLDVSKAIDKMGGRVPWSGFAPMFAEAVGAAGLTYADVDRHLGMAAPGASSCYWARTDHRGGLPPRKYWDALQRLLNLPPEAGKVYDEAEREIIAIERRFNEPSGIVNVGQGERSQVDRKIGSPSSDAAKRWSGYGTALKPAYEPIIVARKPLVSTVAANVLTYGTGALNIDATRVGGSAWTRPGGQNAGKRGGIMGETVPRVPSESNPGGRWPSNVVLVHGEGCVPVGTRKVRGAGAGSTRGASTQVYGGGKGFTAATGEAIGYGDEDGTETVEAWECVEGCPVAEMDAQSGTLTSGVPGVRRKPHATDAMSGTLGMIDRVETGYADTGGASRFFPTFKYQAKADGSERPSYIGPVCHSDSDCTQITDEMHPSVWPEWARDPKGVCPECGTPCGPIMHPTVKPLELARWLIRLVVAKGGTFIDPFVGSGTFAEAAILEGVNAIVVDKVGAHIPFIEQRVTKYDNPHAMAAAQRGEKVATRAKARKGIVTDDEDDLFADWAS